MPILLKFLQKIDGEGMFLNSFYKASINLIPKPDKNTIGKYIYIYIYRLIPLMNIGAEILSKY